MLSLALRSASTNSLPQSACSPLSLAYSASINNVADVEENFEEELLFDDGDAQPGSPASGEATAADAAQLRQRRLENAKQHLQQSPVKLSVLASAWDVPAARTAAVPAVLGGGGGMAQSMPRPISGSRLVRLAAGDDSDEEEPFVPPHLAAGMAEPQVCMSHSMSTKGAAALRLRSTTLRQTGYLEGVMGMPGATPAHLPSA
ncbi:hypothetical protein MNEG_8932 [Monoraphidium neglectum]|uniref:Uncharacterized protein n=1 Tax=Monoraphidium neglectum TaxID=145388 RepID=A0A0D2MXZ1_9CHLO|nr:hypothetical protein MNEG_8932 [Monoraphidium neglectum]KIY99030.1 hypothetical protein MNEG_8932 [Monoraphidium neglectum]|eukprot:XP_013898050.1 hypothetical protein MNEG_8932 [Monoraphidium neglectum]